MRGAATATTRSTARCSAIGAAIVARQPASLAELRGKTIAATCGEADEPIYIALQRVVQKHAIPAVHPLELIRGMEMDVEMEAARAAIERSMTCSRIATTSPASSAS